LRDVCSDKRDRTLCKKDIDDNGTAIGGLPNPRDIACNGNTSEIKLKANPELVTNRCIYAFDADLILQRDRDAVQDANDFASRSEMFVELSGTFDSAVDEYLSEAMRLDQVSNIICRSSCWTYHHVLLGVQRWLVCRTPW
jgi:hypothetical protein